LPIFIAAWIPFIAPCAMANALIGSIIFDLQNPTAYPPVFI
jgi:hypothetical protein